MIGRQPVETLGALRRARDLMDRHYAEPLDLDAIASTAGYSRYYFVRAFREAYGQPPGRYLSQRRVERARELLRSVNLSVTEVCFLVGFSSLGSFSTRFKEVVGVSPSEFQRQARSAGPPPIPGCFALMWSGSDGGRATPKKPAATSRPSVDNVPERQDRKERST